LSKWLRSNSTWLLLFVALSMIGMALDKNGHLRTARSFPLRFMIPLQERFARAIDSTEGIVRTFRQSRELERRNKELEDLVAKLMVENVCLKEVEAENERLRQLLNFAYAHPACDFTAAEVKGRVVGYDPSNLLRYLIIGLDSNHGVKKGMPVVTERGLVGRITEVGPNWAKVMLIIDPSSSVNALIQSSRATGVVEGQAGGRLLMKYIPQGEEVNVGDIVLTSGLGGNFPKGLIIGQVTAVQRSDVEMFQQANVRPTVDFNKLEVVLVVTGFEPIEGVTSEK